jgi:hypothetical protein
MSTTRNDFSEKEITNRTEEIINQFIEYLKQNILVK